VTDPEPSPSASLHRRHAPARVATAVISVSDSRRGSADTGGALVQELLEGAGHPCAGRAAVPDEPAEIAAALRAALARPEVRAVILTGGTGIAPRDRTPEAVAPVLERELPGFGELFRVLSYQEIGAAALLSRALAGLAMGKPVFALPGSPAAVRLALERLILPELGHLVGEAAKGQGGPAPAGAGA
jgi:molybdenum cofactor biosynthesis protein B